MAMTASMLAACGEGPASPQAGAPTRIDFADLSALPADQGHFEVWVRSGADTVRAGVIPPGTGALAPYTFEMPVTSPAEVLVTVEPASDADTRPSRSVLLRGSFSGGTARLSIEGAVTDGRALEDAPGAHSLFTTSNNVELGYPSYENAGLWLFSVAPALNRHGRREVKLTPLAGGWVYEGWIVRQGNPDVWISYGKFRPDELSLVTSRDDSGAGPFAGDEDFINAGVEDVPGEEWTTDRVARQLSIALPAGLSLPLALDAVDGDGHALWHHAITIEPATDEVERPLEGVPFVIRPYENEIGPGGPGEPRFIRLVRPAPSAEVRVGSG